MGGDHKCPVCQATFTRPQHVARHMRSHTGDRPYKCQCCGDQFARSDLLSRHINKCHANEKPLLSGTGARRKGSASASRATTSKQVCDQCVQGSLPCDGSNPCSKCMQRKTRCTFVKFHRQTAPVGPGHNLQSNNVGSIASSLGIPQPLHPSASTSSLNGLAGPSGLSGGGLGPNSLLDIELEGHPSHSGHGHRMAAPLFSTHALERRNYDDDLYIGSHGQSSHVSGGAQQHPATAVSSMAEALGYGGAPGFGFPQGMYGQSTSSQHQQPSGSALGLARQQQGHGLQHTPSPEHFSGSSVGSWDDHGSGAGPSRRTLHSQATTSSAAGSTDYVLTGQTRDMGYGVPRSATVPGGVGGQHIGVSLGMGHHAPNHHPHSQHLHHESQYLGINNSNTIDLNLDLLPPSAASAPPSSTTSAFPVSVQAPSYLLNAQLAQARHHPSQSQQNHNTGSQHAFSRFDLSQSRYPDSNASNSTSNSRRGSVDVYTDGSSDAGHVSNASGRGSVDRLFDSTYPLSANLPERPSTASTTSSSSTTSEHSSQQGETFPTFAAYQGGDYDDRGEFSSSFGLMSLDDPDVTAGIATDGRPFFSHPDQAHNKLHLEHGADMTTPTPAAPGKRDSASMIQFPAGIDLLGGEKEAENKEDLREMWKQYMRTPLSGPEATTPGAGLGLLGGGTPRRQRVSSFPSTRTPGAHDSYLIQGAGGIIAPPSMTFPIGGAPLQQYSQYQQMYLAHNMKDKPAHASGVRTTLQGAPIAATSQRKEDLKSYEAAVLARQMPLTLNLDRPKRSRPRDSSANSQLGARVSFANEVQTHEGDSSSPSNMSRSPSAGAGSESPRPNESGHIEFPSYNYGDSDDLDSPGGGSARPNFKRLPSQTLGPENAKRAYLGYDRDDEDDRASSTVAQPSHTPSSLAQDQPQLQSNAASSVEMGMMSHPDRVVGNLAERRRRRMSAPVPSNGLFVPSGTM